MNAILLLKNHDFGGGQVRSSGCRPHRLHQPVSKNDEFCIKNEEFGIKNEEFCIKND